MLSGTGAGGYNTTMCRTLLPWLAVLLLGSLPLATAEAQTSAPDKKSATLQDLRWRDDQPGTRTPPPGPKQPAGDEHVPVLEYALAIIGTLLVLAIVCTPSRKR